MLDTFKDVWCVDFEFQSLPGEIPRPICMVGLEINSGKWVKLFGDELLATTTCPYPISSDSLMVAYMASAEFSCHLALGWQLPANVLDLYTEFRCTTNGLQLPQGAGLLGALHHFGLNPMAAVKKEAMRSLALRGGPWTESEQHDLLEYCCEDTESLVTLLYRMAPSLDLPRALLRGRSMEAVAQMESTGIPVDVAVLQKIKTNWTSIRQRFIAEADAGSGVYVGTHFSQKKFRDWLDREAIDWPVLDHQGGRPRLDKKTFKTMALRHPQVAPLRDLRQMLAQVKDLALPVGADGYCRAMLSPFRAKTSRNQPSTTKFIFGLSKWSRQLIRPTPGTALAYIDWQQQEFGIAAALSEDTAMMDAYRTGDPYLAFAKQAGAVPSHATKDSHAVRREQYKQCTLAVQYGMGVRSLAERLEISVTDAEVLLAMHHQTYRKFWKWSDAAVDYARLNGMLHSVFGWQINVRADTNERTLRNFPVQTNGAEMLRVSCIELTERRIRVCAPVHDAVLIEAPATEINEIATAAQRIMAEASSAVLGGFSLKSDKRIITESMPWEDSKGQAVWETLMKHLLHAPVAIEDFPHGIKGSLQVSLPPVESAVEGDLS